MTVPISLVVIGLFNLLILVFKEMFYFKLCVCVHAYRQEYGCPCRPEESIRSPGAGVTHLIQVLITET